MQIVTSHKYPPEVVQSNIYTHNLQDFTNYEEKKLT